MEQAQKIISEMLEQGLITAADIRRLGIPTQYVCRMEQRGQLSRIARGIYSSPDCEFTENTGMAVASLMTGGVICLFSALKFHGITVENPHAVWLAIRRGGHIPHTSWPPMQYIFRNEPQFSSDIEEYRMQNVNVRIYSVSRTVADCFQYRNKIGLDVAINALKDAVAKKKADASSLWDAAVRCRVSKIMRPYMEIIL